MKASRLKKQAGSTVSGILAQVGTACGAALWAVLCCLRCLPIYVCRCSLCDNVAANPLPNGSPGAHCRQVPSRQQ